MGQGRGSFPRRLFKTEYVFNRKFQDWSQTQVCIQDPVLAQGAQDQVWVQDQVWAQDQVLVWV